MSNFVPRRQVLSGIAATSAILATGAVAQTTKKIGFILNGVPGDVGWNYEHLRAIEFARSVFDDRVQIDAFYDVGEWGNGDANQLIKMAIDGYDLIFACSYGYGQSVLQIALGAPSILFEHCGGYVRSNNMSTYSARWYEGRVPQGLIAGAVTQNNRIGYLGSFPIPQVIRGINAAYLAAKSVNPNVQFDIVWLNSWFSPDEEERASRSLIEKGADVLLAHTNSTKPVEVAQELGVHAFGQASDMSRYGPDAALSATVNNWGPYYVKRIEAFLDGTWQSTDTWGGFADEMISLGLFANAVPEQTQTIVQSAVERMQTNQHHPFVGPIRRQDGSVWLSDGEIAADASLNTIDFYVEGISSVYPDP